MLDVTQTTPYRLFTVKRSWKPTRTSLNDRAVNLTGGPSYMYWTPGKCAPGEGPSYGVGTEVIQGEHISRFPCSESTSRKSGNELNFSGSAGKQGFGEKNKEAQIDLTWAETRSLTQEPWLHRFRFARGEHRSNASLRKEIRVLNSLAARYTPEGLDAWHLGLMSECDLADWELNPHVRSERSLLVL